MTQFDIIGALRTYCDNLGIVFIWQKDTFYANIQATQQYSSEQLILVADLKPTPIFNGAKVGDITYSGLFMLGRKFDNNGQAASLDEYALQKYDRRLFELTTLLATHAQAFACANDLIITGAPIDYLFNAFDANIDFVLFQNISFLQ